MRILICDDHVVFAESLAALLTSGGREVVAVTTHPRQAIEVLKRASVEVCLADVAFGEESVLGYLAAIRAAAPAIRVILLTGLVDEPLLAAARAAGVNAVVDKRRSTTDLISVIDRAAAGETMLRQSTARPGRRRAGPADDAHRLVAHLTPREREVLSALMRGADTARLARSMDVTLATARCHIQNMLTKLGAHSRLEAVTTAARYRMVDQETGEWLV